MEMKVGDLITTTEFFNKNCFHKEYANKTFLVLSIKHKQSSIHAACETHITLLFGIEKIEWAFSETGFKRAFKTISK